MTERKFHRTILQVDVLSEQPYTTESLAQVHYDIVDGNCSGKFEVVKTEELDGKQAARALRAQESDPSFFRLTEEGEDSSD